MRIRIAIATRTLGNFFARLAWRNKPRSGLRKENIAPLAIVIPTGARHTPEGRNCPQSALAQVLQFTQ